MKTIGLFIMGLLISIGCYARQEQEEKEAKCAMTGNSVMLNDTLLYEAPTHYPNIVVPEEVVYKWRHFRQNTNRKPISIVQSADGNFVDVSTEGAYDNETERMVTRIKLLPGKLNGKPCASIGIETYVSQLNVRAPEDLPLMKTLWYPVLPVDGE